MSRLNIDDLKQYATWKNLQHLLLLVASSFLLYGVVVVFQTGLAILDLATLDLALSRQELTQLVLLDLGVSILGAGIYLIRSVPIHVPTFSKKGDAR